jgi:FGGY-family pentulose kinase
MQSIVLGVDVGTGSARAGAFTLDGTMLAQAARPIRMWRPQAGFVQQSSDDIWAAISTAVRTVLSELPEAQVMGIGFDATCSLVALDASGRPVSVSPDGAAEQNVVVWMDHRAEAQADRINAGAHDVLRYVGGRVSLEMEVPKLLWLKENLPECWDRAAHFFDLPDFLTWRATGSLTRSLCSTVCKWNYRGQEGRWDEGYLRDIGLGELADDGFAGGSEHSILPVGEPVPGGLSAAAAAELGLPAGIPVGTSAIDAHAGGLGVIGAALDGGAPDTAALLTQRLALVGGTSSCHMAVSPEPHFRAGRLGAVFFRHAARAMAQ